VRREWNASYEMRPRARVPVYFITLQFDSTVRRSTVFDAERHSPLRALSTRRVSPGDGVPYFILCAGIGGIFKFGPAGSRNFQTEHLPAKKISQSRNGPTFKRRRSPVTISSTRPAPPSEPGTQDPSTAPCRLCMQSTSPRARSAAACPAVFRLRFPCESLTVFIPLLPQYLFLQIQ